MGIGRRAVLTLFLIAPLLASAQVAVSERSRDEVAFLAVARAWFLPPETAKAALEWAGSRPADLAVAAFLARHGGLAPAESWALKVSLRTWDAAARKAGVPVDDLLKGYRERFDEKTRASLAPAGEDLVVLAELETLERLTGKGPPTVARGLAAAGFDALLLDAAPKGGMAEARPKPSPSGSGAPGPTGDSGMNPLQPVLGQTPPNTGIVGTNGAPQPRGR